MTRTGTVGLKNEAVDGGEDDQLPEQSRHGVGSENSAIKLRNQGGVLRK